MNNKKHKLKNYGGRVLLVASQILFVSLLLVNPLYFVMSNVKGQIQFFYHSQFLCGRRERDNAYLLPAQACFAFTGITRVILSF
jgi:hypothetical protein